MRILYIITQADGGGAQKYTLALARHFNGVVAAGNEAGKLFTDARRAGLTTFELKHLKRNISPWHDLRAVWEIHKLIKSYKPDIVNLNSSKAGILGSFAIIGTKVRVVFTAHGFVFNEPLNFAVKNFYLALEKIASGYRNYIITVSDADRRSALNNKLIAADKISTIHNGLPKIDFLPKDRARQELGLTNPLPNPPPSDALGEREKRTGLSPVPPPLPTCPTKLQRSWMGEGRPVPHRSQTTGAGGEGSQNGIIIGNTSNFYLTKGLDVLVNAIAMLDKKSPPDFFLAILGKGKLQKDLEQQIARLNLGAKIRLLTNLQRADIYLKAFDIFVLPSRKEGLPFALLEAMQAGLPIIATNVGGIPEALGDAGILVEPENPLALAGAIQSLQSNISKQKDLSQKALERSKLFTQEKMLAETEKIYRKLLG